MKLSKWIMAAIGLATAGAAVSPASAAPGSFVERSGLVYHIAVCGHGMVAGISRCNAHVVTDGAGNVLELRHGNGGLMSPNLAENGAVPFGPHDLAAAYNLPTAGSTITGPTIAIVDAFGYPNAAADLATYRSNYHLPACTKANGCFTQVNQNGGTALPRYNLGWAQETALDLDMVSAACPTCRILLVEATNNYTSNLAIAVNYAASQRPRAISNSYGGPESGTTYQSNYNHAGIAITASTGDSGWGAQFPATSPTVIAVGGTSLYHQADGAGRSWRETAWSGAGSGCSKYFSKPTWQSDAGCPSNRMEADVSSNADPNTGVAVYGPATRSRTAWMQFGGTSASAPFIGGLYGRTTGAVSAASTIYGHSGNLYDVKSGKNGSCTTYICNAVTGYDGPTGLGTPNGVMAFGY
jgi:hypothetical protein